MLSVHTDTKQLIPAILLYHRFYHMKPIPGHKHYQFESLAIVFGPRMREKELLGQFRVSPFNEDPKRSFMGKPFNIFSL